jgi:hypothetical protein
MNAEFFKPNFANMLSNLLVNHTSMRLPKRPAQPAQSPDLNPLDTFIFRALATKWRRLRARDLVRQMATDRARLESSAGQKPSASRGAVRRIDFDDYDGGSTMKNLQWSWRNGIVLPVIRLSRTST